MSIQAAVTLAYLLCVAASIAALTVALRPRVLPAPPPRAPGPTDRAPAEEADIRAILTAAARLAARLSPAA